MLRPPKSRALHLSDGARERVAARFRVLGEATRIKILDSLFEGPASVNEILEAVGGTQANVSKHLALLHAEGLVSRRKEGTRAVYSISDPTVRRLCAIVCDAVEDEARRKVERIARG
jgi:DNA-binding transcriptional ArsR family regulator